MQIMGIRRWRKQCKEAYDNCFFEKVFRSKPTKYTIGFTNYSPCRRQWVKTTHLPGKKKNYVRNGKLVLISQEIFLLCVTTFKTAV